MHEDNITMLSTYLQKKYERDLLSEPSSYLGYSLSWLRTIADNLDGIQEGLYLIAAETNVGKTALMTNLFIDILNTNTLAKGIYFSFDDNKDAIINRFLSLLTAIDINYTKAPCRLTEEGRSILTTFGYGRLNEWAESEKLNIYDMNDVTNFTQLHDLIKQHSNPDQLVICIDAIHNLSMSETVGIREENIMRANKLKWLVDTYRIPVLVTAEVRKKEAKGALNIPTTHDIMESSKFAYNAQVVFMLHSEQSYLPCDTPTSNLVINCEKNKLSGFKGKMNFCFLKNMGRLVQEEDLSGFLGKMMCALRKNIDSLIK